MHPKKCAHCDQPATSTCPFCQHGLCEQHTFTKHYPRGTAEVCPHWCSNCGQ